MRYKNNIGPQVRRRRYALGWSQSTFAAKLEILEREKQRLMVPCCGGVSLLFGQNVTSKASTSRAAPAKPNPI